MTETKNRPASLEAPPNVPLGKVLWKVDSAAHQRGKMYVARFVPYLNAAIVAGLLDGWVGASHWWDEYHTVAVTSAKAGEVHHLEECRLTVRVPDGAEWREVTKADVGAAPSGGAEMGGKGARSDAFKRAATLKWGVGRNVYELPNLWAPVTVPNVSNLKQCYPHRDGTTQQAIRQQLADLGFEDVAAEPSPDEFDGAEGGGE